MNRNRIRLHLVVDNTEAHAVRARNRQLAKDLDKISDIALDGHISTLVWVIVKPDGNFEHGILGEQGADLPTAIQGAESIRKALEKRQRGVAESPRAAMVDES